MKPSFVPLAVVSMLFAGACANNPPDEDDGPISFERNSEFSGPHLRVFLSLADGTDLSVNTADNAVETNPGSTPLPGHEARDWTFVKVDDDGTSVVYALVSWDSLDAADYLMAGWWAQFPGQRHPDISFGNSIQYAIVDGPELDSAKPPELPASGQASYVGQAGGLYAYRPGSDWTDDAQGRQVVEEWEGHIALTADFSDGTISGCVGCDGELVTQRAHFGFFLGDEVRDIRGIARDYELHLGAAPISPEGTISHPKVTVRHPERSVISSQGHWGGGLSNSPDGDGNPRLAAGFVRGAFEESDESSGLFFGVFVAPTKTYAMPDR